MRIVIVVFLIVLLIFVSGCIVSDDTATFRKSLTDACINICKSSTLNLSNGPCLSDNNSDWNVTDWVCDVAHSPRQDIDNLPGNQCQAFRNGQAHHFVEVNTTCNLIRAV